MVFVKVSPGRITTHVSRSPIFSGVQGFQQPPEFLSDAMVNSMAHEIDVIQEECGFDMGSGDQHESVANLLTHFCVFLPPFNDQVDVPTAVFSFYSDLPPFQGSDE